MSAAARGDANWIYFGPKNRSFLTPALIDCALCRQPKSPCVRARSDCFQCVRECVYLARAPSGSATTRDRARGDVRSPRGSGADTLATQAAARSLNRAWEARGEMALKFGRLASLAVLMMSSVATVEATNDFLGESMLPDCGYIHVTRLADRVGSPSARL